MNKGVLIVNLNDSTDEISQQKSQKILESLGQIKKLPQFEKIVVYEKFTIENNFLTPTQKVKFKEVIKHYLNTDRKLVQ